MNIELIKKQIKELDTEDKIKDIYINVGIISISINLEDLFEITYWKKEKTIRCSLIEDEIDNSILYDEHYKTPMDNTDYYINIATFFKENKDKIKQIIKDNL